MNFSTSASTEKLDAALAKAQGEFAGAHKDAVNPHFKSRYADLSAVWEVIRAPLSKHGLAISQWPVHSDDGRMHLVTRLACSGEWIMSTYSSPVGAQTAQAMGSAITYAKRYTLMAILGIPSEDDDGEAASTKPSSQPAPQPRIAATPAHVTPAQVVAPKSEALPSQGIIGGTKQVTEPQLKRMFAIAHSQGWTNDQLKETLAQLYGVKSSKELNQTSYEAIVDHVQKNPKVSQESDVPIFDAPFPDEQPELGLVR